MTDQIPETPVTPEEMPALDPVRSLLGLFDKQTLKQWWAKVQHGLAQPKDSGEYKWARVQVWRISARPWRRSRNRRPPRTSRRRWTSRWTTRA